MVRERRLQMKAACVGGMVPVDLIATSYSPPAPLPTHRRSSVSVGGIGREENELTLGETIRQLVFKTPLMQVSTLLGIGVWAKCQAPYANRESRKGQVGR